MQDRSAGYEQAADVFILRRNPVIGAAIVREWSGSLVRGTSVLDLGCGSGVPVSQVLHDQGFKLYGIDASAKMIAAYRERFPEAHTECADVADSTFFNRTFDAVIAWGLIFLLEPDAQRALIGKVSRALKPGGQFVFTSPERECSWPDSLTGQNSISLGSHAYKGLLHEEGLMLLSEQSDEGDNHYYICVKA